MSISPVVSGLVRGGRPGPPGPPTAPDAVTGGPAATAPAGLAAPRSAGASVRQALLAGPAGLLVADVAALAVAAVVSGPATPLLTGYAAAAVAILATGGLYRVRITPRAADQAGRFLAAATPALALVAWLRPDRVLGLAVATAGLLACARAGAYAVIREARRRGLVAEPALVVGAGQVGQQVAAAALAHPELGLRLAGYLDTRPAPDGSPVPVLGPPAALAAAVRAHGIRRVIVAFPEVADSELVALLRAAGDLPAEVCVVPRLPEVGTSQPRAALDEAWGTPLVPLRRHSRAAWLAKRGLDVAIALVLLALAAPLLLVFGAAVRLRLRRPALFRQTRVTGQGRLAEIVKLRTVTVHGDPDTCWVVPPERATALGRFLRATHLDELPQLVNVLRGDMSLVGPRPERPFFARRFEEEIPGYRDRHRVTAGLTGWAQVHGLNGDTSIRDRARFDNAYIENWSLWLDLVILARTVAASVVAAIVRGDDGLRRAGRAAATPAGCPAAASHTARSGPRRGSAAFPVTSGDAMPPPGPSSPVSPSGGPQ